MKQCSGIGGIAYVTLTEDPILADRVTKKPKGNPLPDYVVRSSTNERDIEWMHEVDGGELIISFQVHPDRFTLEQQLQMAEELTQLIENVVVPSVSPKLTSRAQGRLSRMAETKVELITDDQVRHVASLARLELTEREVSEFSEQLAQILQRASRIHH